MVFVTLAFTAFALTSLDTATRLGRYIFQEYFETKEGEKNLLADKYVATLITIVASYILLAYGYQKIWPIFGSANQLLSALSLLALTAWLVRTGKNMVMTFLPMLWMFAVTLSATLLLMKNFYYAGNYVLVVMSIALFALAIVLMVVTYNTLKKARAKNAASAKMD
ncbi:MAG: hypothetical protein L5655_10655 [Thermosediminibacteraceae bacterium]|nr:hypothetical protein [Thermosediminibacteraceae bacterium]